MLDGLSTVSVELSSRCNKSCWMCGRRKIEREYPELVKWGDMDYELVKSIAKQLPEGIVVQFHDNGEPLLYPHLGKALALFENQIRCLDTNGKLLMEKADEIIGNLDTITTSVFEGDTESATQLDTLTKFIKYKGDRIPTVIVRILGEVNRFPYIAAGANIIATRILHKPEGSFGYTKQPTIPEIGICLDLLHHLVIKRDGKVSMCVRFDPKGELVIGDVTRQPLIEIWHSEKRKRYIATHIAGKRDTLPLCDKCEYWGCPTGN